MRIIHMILGAIILLFEWILTPRGIKRSQEKQAIVDSLAAQFTLYQYKACPFCVKVRRSIKQLSLPIETKDAKRSVQSREELVAGGGKLKVPCLRIKHRDGKIEWMYESNDIITYLNSQFGQDQNGEANMLIDAA